MFLREKATGVIHIVASTGYYDPSKYEAVSREEVINREKPKLGNSQNMLKYKKITTPTLAVVKRKESNQRGRKSDSKHRPDYASRTRRSRR